jgi:hypothetical protein
VEPACSFPRYSLVPFSSLLCPTRTLAGCSAAGHTRAPPSFLLAPGSLGSRRRHYKTGGHIGPPSTCTGTVLHYPPPPTLHERALFSILPINATFIKSGRRQSIAAGPPFLRLRLSSSFFSTTRSVAVRCPIFPNKINTYNKNRTGYFPYTPTTSPFSSSPLLTYT